MITFSCILILNLLLIEGKSLKDSRFLTDSDFKNADKLSIEEIDRGVGFVNETAEFNPHFFGGDIVHKPSKKRVDIHGYITKSSGRHWPNGRIPYEFFDFFSPEEKAHIAKAFSYFHNKTCIRFVKREPEDKSYIKFTKDEGCFSDYLGRKKRKSQEVSLSEECMRVDIITHELMHAIGFMHEFSRPDRDKYIDIYYDNIDPSLDAKSQFLKQSGEVFGDWNLTFDVKSAMFYEGNIAAKDPNIPVMRAKNGEELRCKPHECPTELDTIKINTIYNCRNYKTKASETASSSNLSLDNTHSCSLLQWESRKHFNESDNPVVSQKTSSGKHLICRALLYNGRFMSGETNGDNSRCIIISNGLGYSWDFISYDILVNPFNKAIEWQNLSHQTRESGGQSDDNNWMLVDKKNGKNTYVTRCSKYKVLLKHLRLCLAYEILKC